MSEEEPEADVGADPPPEDGAAPPEGGPPSADAGGSPEEGAPSDAEPPVGSGDSAAPEPPQPPPSDADGPPSSNGGPPSSNGGPPSSNGGPPSSNDGTGAPPGSDPGPGEPSVSQPPSSKTGSQIKSKASKKAGSKSSKKGASGKPPKQKKGQVSLTTARYGVLGAGKIAEAMVRGMITHAKVNPKMIYVSSKSGKTLSTFKKLGCKVTKRFYDIFGKFDSDMVILALHGFAIRECYKLGGTRPLALATNYIPNQRHPLYILSLIGGVKLLDIKNTLLNPDHPEKYKIEMHRCSINTAVSAGNGLAAIDVEPNSKKCSPIFRNLLSAFAKLEFVTERYMDVMCALTGNGLAFHYYFVNAISEGGAKMGLPKSVAVMLAAKVLKSASASLLESGKHPSDLRDQCTSPSGPAIYGIHMLEKQDCASGVSGAVDAAYKRIKELAEVPHNDL